MSWPEVRPQDRIWKFGDVDVSVLFMRGHEASLRARSVPAMCKGSMPRGGGRDVDRSKRLVPTSHWRHIDRARSAGRAVAVYQLDPAANSKVEFASKGRSGHADFLGYG